MWALVEAVEAQQLLLFPAHTGRDLKANALVWHQGPILQSKGDIARFDFGITELHRLFPPEHVFHWTE
jgi:hypothetical protein